MKIHAKMYPRPMYSILVGLFAWLFLVSIASADAVVVVKLRDPDGNPADGKVTLKAVGKKGEHKCQTSKGMCQISGVPGGKYMVVVVPDSGSAPSPRKAMIPPSGKVELFVSTGGKGKGK